MSTFDDDFAEASDELFTEFGETIVYRPLNGMARPIAAMVDRGPPEPTGEAPRMIAPHFVIEVYDDCLTGIESHALDLGGDKVDIVPWPGRKAETYSITRRMTQSDNGLLKLECG